MMPTALVVQWLGMSLNSEHLKPSLGLGVGLGDGWEGLEIHLLRIPP